MADRNPDLFFEQLAEATAAAPGQAPSRWKSRLYSALVRAAQQDGPLCALSETRAAGRGLCVFEELVTILPAGKAPERMNPCRVCHARLLAERFENPPIYWPNCPYVRFQRR